MKIGLALGSGGARGWIHLGVIRELEANGIFPDIVAGTSMGAVVGAFYCLERLDELEQFGNGLTEKRLFSMLNLSQIFTGKRLMGEVGKRLGTARFGDCKTAFGCVATELGTGHERWFREGHMFCAIAASSALPGVLDPVKTRGSWYVDGAMVDPVPVSLARAMGADVIIASSIIADSMYKGRQIHEVLEGSEASEVDAAIDHSILRFVPGLGKKEDKAPPVSTVMTNALDIMLDRIRRAKLAGDPPDISICTRADEFGMFDFHKASALIEHGRASTRAIMPAILSAIGR